MKDILETICEIMANVLEKDFELFKPEVKFLDVGIDSLGLLMVIVGVANEYNIVGTEQEVVELVKKLETIQDMINHVKNHIGK